MEIKLIKCAIEKKMKKNIKLFMKSILKPKNVYDNGTLAHTETIDMV